MAVDPGAESGRNEPGNLERAREMFTEMGALGYVRVLEERLGEFRD
jgi:hypothetical protein